MIIMSKVRGYVYILTNPSFREDWIKIWKCADDPIKRAKQLDTTAIPLPFEVYATIQTEKYEVLEKHLHKIFGKFANKRIRDGREFFNIKPETALEEFIDQQKMLDDAEVLWPEWYRLWWTPKVETPNIPQKCWTHGMTKRIPIDNDKIYYFKKGRVTEAYLIVREWKFIVTAWSKIYKDITNSIERISKLRDQYKNYLKDYEVIKDIPFDNPSAAWDFVYWWSINWWTDWRDKDNKSLDENIRKKIKK